MADDSEEACLVNPKSTNSGLQYTEGTTQSSIDSNKHSSRRIDTPLSHKNNDNSDQYDINDEIILSQFHADAIKQVCKWKIYFLNEIRKNSFFLMKRNLICLFTLHFIGWLR